MKEVIISYVSSLNRTKCTLCGIASNRFVLVFVAFICTRRKLFSMTAKDGSTECFQILWKFDIETIWFIESSTYRATIFRFNSFLASLPITFANSLDQDLDQQNVGSCLDPNRLTL